MSTLWKAKYLIGIAIICFTLCCLEKCYALSDKSYHMIADLSECDKELLDDPNYLVELLQIAATDYGFNVLDAMVHKFEPQGVTAMLLLSESHFSIHTWPEDGVATVDLFTCGDTKPESAVKYVRDKLGCKADMMKLIHRRVK